MSILQINKFLILENLTYQAKKFNVIIGKQASGKSLIVKLDYFFQTIFNEILYKTLKLTKKEFETEIKDIFNNYFPKYSWEKEEINIEYNIDNFQLIISKTKTQKTIKLLFNQEFIKFRNNKKNELKKLEKNDMFEKIEFYTNKTSNIFIPAVRSLFSNIEKNIFLFNSEKINLDPFLLNLGKYYEIVKENYFINEEMKQQTFSILNGEFVYKNKESWINQNNKLIKLINSSSGQQETLPLLLILNYFSENGNNYFFVEEPEAHIFPKSQKTIIELLSISHNMNNNISITTHSPYILSSINNLIVLNEVIKKGHKKELSNKSLKIENVSAYMLENGNLINIIEDNLINASKIDDISNDINEEFDEYMNLIYGI